MKVAPLHRAFVKTNLIESKIVHTGQHFDEKMSDVFFKQLELPKPNYYLGIGGGSHTQVTAKTMLELEQIFEKEKPDLILVVGDVNATVAASVVAVKMGISLAHVEAGLRSGDRKMPEEINRIITDSISNLLFVTESAGLVNLAKENISDDKIFFVGNVMIDSLIYYLKKAEQSTILYELGLEKYQYILVTMHRPSNVDTQEGLEKIVQILLEIAKTKKVVFPIHPRTKNNFSKYSFYTNIINNKNILLIEPQGYLEFLQLMKNTLMLLTDSGGIQEESTYLKIPCLTFRDTTERPVTVELGSNQLLHDLKPTTVITKVNEILDGKVKEGIIPPLWDGSTAERVANIIIKKYAKQ
jgi:UDP-N-acetylglucosamine 2-epimerase (non-hydrolysing)